MDKETEKEQLVGADIALTGHTPQLLLTPSLARASHSLISQEDAGVLQAEQVGQVHGWRQVSRDVSKLWKVRETGLEWGGLEPS